MAHSTKAVGYGLDGYMIFQKETVFGAASAEAAVYMPILGDAVINSTFAQIESANTVGTRYRQTPTSGGETVSGSVQVEIHPEQIGFFLDSCMAPSNASNGGNGSKIKDFVFPITGDTADRSVTITQALGGSNANKFVGCKVTSMSISCAAGETMKATLEFVGTSLISDDTARTGTTFSSNFAPYTSFDLNTCTITHSGIAPAYDLKAAGIYNFEFNWNMGYVTDERVFGSRIIREPKFNGIHEATLTLGIDADREFLQYSRDLLNADISVGFVHSSDVAGHAGDKYGLTLDVNDALLSPESTISNGQDRIKQDLTYACNLATWKFIVEDETTTY